MTFKHLGINYFFESCSRIWPKSPCSSQNKAGLRRQNSYTVDNYLIMLMSNTFTLIMYSNTAVNILHTHTQNFLHKFWPGSISMIYDLYSINEYVYVLWQVKVWNTYNICNWLKKYDSERSCKICHSNLWKSKLPILENVMLSCIIAKN